MATAPAKVTGALDRIAAELQPSGYLVGDRFSVADLTAAALFSPLVMPPEHPYPPAEPPPRSLMEFRDSLASHPAFAWVAEMYRRHRGISAEMGAGRSATPSTDDRVGPSHSG
jgi:glutathione S-transferase